MFKDQITHPSGLRIATAALAFSTLALAGCSPDSAEHSQASEPGVEQTTPGPTTTSAWHSNCEDLGAKGFTTHPIQPGDTMSAISRTTHIDAQALNEFNVRSGAVSDPNAIRAGDCVVLPVSTVEPVSNEQFARMQGLSWRPGCIGQTALRVVRVPYYNNAGQATMGSVVVSAQAAPSIAAAFEDIVAEAPQFMFEKIAPLEDVPGIEAYRNGDALAMDEHVMASNTTTAFACRPIEGSSTMSEHGKGLAIDINPRTNPEFFSDGTFAPANANPDRNQDPNTPGFLSRAGGPGKTIIDIFQSYGYDWGGDWNSPVDLQHFELAS